MPSSELWQCWNLECLATNPQPYVCCFSCGSERNYKSPALEALLTTEKAKSERAGRIDELTDFELLFKGDHSKCPDPMTCIGYQNAQSDFDNEKAIRLAELQAEQEME